MTQASFPGLFDKVFQINPVAFSVFGLSVHWYGLIICTGIILAVMNTVRCAQREKLTTDDVLDYALWVVPLSILGARLYYVITSPSEYNSFSEVIAIWNGGLAIYGAIIAGAITVFAVSKFKKISFFKIGDAACASIPIGQAIGRWGNFCNGEAYGHLDRFEILGKVIDTPTFTSDYFLRMSVSSEATGGVLMNVHPTFLYESVWNFIGFIIINLLYKKKKFDGQIILYYLCWYGLGRFFIEGLRADSLMLGNTNIRISQLLALLTFLFSLLLLIFISVRKAVNSSNDTEYVKQFTVSENTIGIIPGSASTENLKSEVSDVGNEATEKSKESSNTTSEENENGSNN